MDSEVTNLAQVKAFSSADYATAAQGALADSALQADENETITGQWSYLASATVPVLIKRPDSSNQTIASLGAVSGANGQGLITVGNNGTLCLQFMGAGGNVGRIDAVSGQFGITTAIGTGPHARLMAPATGIWQAIGSNASTGAAFCCYALAAEPTMPSNSAGVYAIGDPAELYAVDESGNETLLSEHATDAPAAWYTLDPSDPLPRIGRHSNKYLGVIVWEYYSQGLRHVETFAEYAARTGTPERQRGNWDTDWDWRQQLYNTERQREVQGAAEWQAAHAEATARRAAWDALKPEERTGPRPQLPSVADRPEVRPAADIRKPPPPHIRARGVTSTIPDRQSAPLEGGR